MYVKLAAVSALLATAANGYYLPLAQTGTALPLSQQQPLIQAPEQETATTTTRPYVLNEEAAAAYWAERIKNGFPFDQVTTPPSPLDENTIADINQVGNEDLSAGMDTTGERASPYGSQSVTTPTTTAASTTTASSTVASTTAASTTAASTTAASTTAASTTAASTTAASTTAASTTAAAPRAGYATPKKENRSGSTMDVTGGASPYGAPKTTPKVATTSPKVATTSPTSTVAAPQQKRNELGSGMVTTVGRTSPYGSQSTTTAPKATTVATTTVSSATTMASTTVAAPPAGYDVPQDQKELGSGMDTTVGRTSPYGSQSTTTAPKTTTVAATTASSTTTMASTTVAAPQAGYDIPQDQNELGSGMDSTTESAAPLYETTMSSGSQLEEDDLLTGSGSGMYAAVGPNSAYVSPTRPPNVATTSTAPTSTIATTQASYGVPQEHNEFGSGMDVTDGSAVPLYETAQFGDDVLLTDGNGSGMYIAIGPNSLYELPY